MDAGSGREGKNAIRDRFRAASFDKTLASASASHSAEPNRLIRNQGGLPMRVMVIVKANKDSEAGILPDPKIFTAMGKYNDELVKAGIMLAADGLRPSSKGKRVKFSGAQRIVTDGPFAESKELIAGFWIWQVKSMDEAVEWLKRAPFDGGVEIELRPFHEAEDFASVSPDIIEQQNRLQSGSKDQEQSAKN
jgi:hypothetical protein